MTQVTFYLIFSSFKNTQARGSINILVLPLAPPKCWQIVAPACLRLSLFAPQICTCNLHHLCNLRHRFHLIMCLIMPNYNFWSPNCNLERENHTDIQLVALQCVYHLMWCTGKLPSMGHDAAHASIRADAQAVVGFFFKERACVILDDILWIILGYNVFQVALCLWWTGHIIVSFDDAGY